MAWIDRCLVRQDHGYVSLIFDNVWLCDQLNWTVRTLLYPGQGNVVRACSTSEYVTFAWPKPASVCVFFMYQLELKKLHVTCHECFQNQLPLLDTPPTPHPPTPLHRLTHTKKRKEKERKGKKRVEKGTCRNVSIVRIWYPQFKGWQFSSVLVVL